MGYYFIKNSSDSTSFLRIGADSKTIDIQYNNVGYLDYMEPIDLILRGEETERLLYFPFHQWSNAFIDFMTPELKVIIGKFNLPKHRWYKAKASYDREFVWDMHTYFGIEYDIDLQEERDYWILQILDQQKEELAFDQMEWNIVEFSNRNKVIKKLDEPITSFQQYIDVGKEVYLNSKLTDVKKDIEAPVYIYKKNYDILWGGIHIVFNEKVKAALEETNIITPENGLEFAEFTDYETVMLGEDQ